MEVSWSFLVSSLVFTLLVPASTGQLSPTEIRILFQVQKLVEYPQPLQGWNNWTNFCYLPYSPSLKIVCTDNHVTELSITGNKTSPRLSDKFSIDAFFTTLTKLSSLKVLSLVSLGLWGPLPAKINRFRSLEVLNISSNFIHGEIPPQIGSFKSLKSLVLADNLFNGSVPDLQGLSLLQELNLGGNHLGPKLPLLTHNLVILNLRNNSFRSEIPSQFKNFNQLQHLDISLNKFIGPIPSFIFSSPSIQYLNLAKNQLNGALPGNIPCSSKLLFLDISSNLLTGKLPSCFSSKSSNRTVISSWNCLSNVNSKNQHPHSFCQKEALAVKPPIETQGESSSTVKLGLILGIIGGVVGTVVLLGLLILIIVRRSDKNRTKLNKFNRSVPDKIPVRSSPKPVLDTRRVPHTMRSAVIGLPPYRVFTIDEIEDATNNFEPENLVREETQGQVYKGWLRDGTMVMVKCVNLKQKNLPQTMMQQMEVLSKLRHLHLVSVLGHCIVTYQDHPHTPTTIFVVLEHISNGSLQDYLADWRKKEILKWPQRMAITIGVARGIQFLHTGVSPGIFGNDLNIEKILLDESLTAKISGYNIPLPSKTGSESPLSGLNMTNHGSSEGGEKEDVYQFGLILLQVITGKLIASATELDELKLQLEISLAEGPSKLRSVTDPSVKGTYAYESLRTAVEFTINCLCKDPSKRPSIEDVIWNLQYTIQVQDGWTSSGNLGTQM